MPANNEESLLLVVDSESKASRLIRALEPEGYPIETLFVVNNAIDSSPGKVPSLVLLWVYLSTPDTLNSLGTLVQQLRDLGGEEEVPLLLIVDQDGSQFIEPGFKLGVTDILSRPIHPLVLRHRINLILQARRTEMAEERFKTVADFTYDWEYWKGADGRILYNSPSCERITGYLPQQYLQDPDLLLNIVHPEDREQVARHFTTAENSPDVFSVDFRILTREHEVRWIGHVCQPVYSASHQFIGRRISNRDISDRHAAEERIIRSERLAAIGKLTASLAHEINNPLQAMSASIELLTEFSLEEVEQKKYLQITQMELDRLRKITRGILDFSRSGAGKMELSPIESIVDEALFLAANQMQSSGVEITKIFPAKMQPIWQIPDQIKQVCLNLIINALEHMPAGGRLTIKGWETETQQWISFADSGSGISPQNLEKIFDPFFSTKEHGTGLGLAISKEIMSRHQGDIQAHSQIGQGSTFTLNFPLMESKDEGKHEWII